ncbi:hypothetical protein Taro_029988 [Colocasia esculenta]|uniref:non-specific serine/threonine protein kinase n=1 Tax=Colocasia esculenta TaxID=4460 RepID=A0A843VKB4_COLES|nr:hypothetical protein [Colocasia esculenta]
MSRPWRPFTATCCAAEDVSVISGRLRCRPTCSDLSKKVAELPSRRSQQLPYSVLGSSRPFGAVFDDELISGTGLHIFRLSELRAVTGNFSGDFFLGEGGFGAVYKGYVDDDKLRRGLKAQAVAVKLLDVEGFQGHREWMAEVVLLGQLRHPNLVKLIGYCCEGQDRVLVYEFMSRGSLENHLFRRSSVSLSWSIRLKVALGAAKGLAFLHGAENPVIYRDFKASNVLLDSLFIPIHLLIEGVIFVQDFTAKLSDFGLAKLGPVGKATHVTTRVMGTHGYAAPESMDKTRSKCEENMVEWAKPYLTSGRKLRCIMDPKLRGGYSMKGAQEVALLALKCVNSNPKDRPEMPAVVQILEGLQHLIKEQLAAVDAGSPLVGKRVMSIKSRMEMRNGIKRNAFSARLY